MLAENAAGEAFGNAERLLNALDTDAAAGGAYQFPDAASFRISFSSVRSDTALRSRAFSASRSFSRLPWSPFSPPYSCGTGNFFQERKANPKNRWNNFGARTPERLDAREGSLPLIDDFVIGGEGLRDHDALVEFGQ